MTKRKTYLFQSWLAKREIRKTKRTNAYRSPPVYEMMKDKFANYVVQKAVEVTKPPMRDVLINKVMLIRDPNNYCKEDYLIM